MNLPLEFQCEFREDLFVVPMQRHNQQKGGIWLQDMSNLCHQALQSPLISSNQSQSVNKLKIDPSFNNTSFPLRWDILWNQVIEFACRFWIDWDKFLQNVVFLTGEVNKRTYVTWEQRLVQFLWWFREYPRRKHRRWLPIDSQVRNSASNPQVHNNLLVIELNPQYQFLSLYKTWFCYFFQPILWFM